MRIRLLFNSDSSPLHGTNLAFLSFKGPLDQYYGTALDQIALRAPDNFVVPEATSGAGDNVPEHWISWVCWPSPTPAWPARSPIRASSYSGGDNQILILCCLKF